MALNEDISNFVRDAQYKLALMTSDMANKEKRGETQYATLKKQRHELQAFFTILYDTLHVIDDGFNWLENASWTEADILEEIDYLRNKYGLNGLPAIDYGFTVNQIINFVRGDGTGTTLPTPVADGNILVAQGGQWVVGDINPYAGMLDSETLNIYFGARP